jgi:hypothetical protein
LRPLWIVFYQLIYFFYPIIQKNKESKQTDRLAFCSGQALLLFYLLTLEKIPIFPVPKSCVKFR